MTTVKALLLSPPVSRGRRTASIIVGLVLAIVALSTASAYAGEVAEPWWHLVSVTQPSDIQPGHAKDEVQLITVDQSAGNYELRDKGVGFRAYGENQEATIEVGAEPKKVQEALETMYGANNVEVTGGPGAGNNPYEVYEVKFVGKLTDQYVAPLTEAYNEGKTTVTELVKGRPDGTIVVSAANLGDADANPATQTIDIKDALPPGLTAIGIEATADESVKRLSPVAPPLECVLESLSCTFTGTPPLSADEEEAEHYASSIPPYYRIAMRIAVNVDGATSGESNEASITGGGAPAATTRAPVVVSDATIPFGMDSYEIRPEEAGGGIDTQAGSHPFQLTTAFNLNESTEGQSVAFAKDLHFKLPPGLVGNPTPFAQCSLANFLGKVCPMDTVIGVAAGTAKLVFNQQTLFIVYQTPLFNLEPSVGEPARFGFIPNENSGVGAEPQVLLTTAVRAGGDYGVTVTVSNITETTEFLSSETTFWGTPGEPLHNVTRGQECLVAGYDEVAGYKGRKTCPPFQTASHPPPLMTLPTSCSGRLHTTMEADSWLEPTVLQSTLNTLPMPGLDGCNRLPFVPEIKVTPDGTEASKPTGLNIDVHVPQEGQLNGAGLSQSNIKGITVKLPAGVAINPSSGDGLQACSSEPSMLGGGVLGSAGDQVGYEGEREFEPIDEPGVKMSAFTHYVPGSYDALGAGFGEALQPGVDFCPNASKVATVRIKTPLLPNPLEGSAYLAAQESNPFGSVLAMYLVAEDPVSGSLVKLPGEVQLCKAAGEVIAGMTCEALGQLISTFENNPQLPFEDAELHFFGGERAPLATPSHCGTYTTEASYAPWAGNPPVKSTSSFEINSGPNHTRCVYAGEPLPFSPSLTGGGLSVNAGWFSPFDATFSRSSGEQNMQSIEVHLPPGLSGILTGVELCPEPQANLGECGPNSLIGETTVGVGVGGEPYTVSGGKFYLTGPYNGTGVCTVGTPGCAPFGITFVVPAKAGPFDFADTNNNHPACDCVLVRGKIEINPITAAITITSNPPGTPYAIPTSIEGVPLEIQHVNAITTRTNFQFNPTNCNKMAVTGTIHSSEGATDNVSVPFQVTNCAVLGFKPGFKISTSGKTSRARGASLNVKLTYPKAPFGTQANIKSIKVDLPKQLPSRLTTLQKACPARTFEANPADCSAASIVGHATAITPLIPVPLTGPAYFVSYGGAKFPELVIVLQGYGVTLDVHGETFINKAGITSSTFHTIPDAPVGSFEMTLPQGPDSALAANGNLCKSTLKMPTAFVAQNGRVIKQSTPISVTGCPKKVVKAKAKKFGKRHKSKSSGKKK